MQIDHIILFNKIATQKSISKVAAECHLSQPALSQQMRKLEDEMGLRLFERSNRGIELTEAGRTVHKYFHQMIDIYDGLQEEIDNLKKYSGTIRILASPVVGQYALPCSLHKMSEKFNKYNFSLSIMTSSEVVRKVQEGNGSIGFIVSPVDNPELFCKHVYSDKLHLVCAERYFKENSMTLDQLKKHPLITLIDKFSSRRILDKGLKEAGHDISEFSILMNLDSTESVKASVIANLGFAFLPYMAIKKELYLKQLKIVEIPDFQLSYDLHMIHKESTDFQDVPLEVVRYIEKIVDETFC